MGSCEEHRSRPYIWCGLHSCEIVACLQARTWLLSRGPWWPWVAWLWQRAMGATKETPTGSTSKFELVTLWKVAQTKEGFISALRNDTVDWEMCVCFVCAGRPKRTEETSQTNSWPKAKTSSACKWAQMQEHLKLEWRATADPGRSSTTTPERTPPRRRSFLCPLKGQRGLRNSDSDLGHEEECNLTFKLDQKQGPTGRCAHIQYKTHTFNSTSKQLDKAFLRE